MLYLGVAAFAVSAWTLFVMWAMSAEKASSSGRLRSHFTNESVCCDGRC